MGGCKSLQQEIEERGWEDQGTVICEACMGDSDLAERVGDSMDADDPCSYCEATPSAPFEIVMTEIMEVVREDYQPIEEAEFYRDSEEQDWAYAGSRWDFRDIVNETLPNARSSFLDHLDSSVSNAGWEWVSQYTHTLSPEDGLRFSWGQFVAVVKYQSRFVFMVDETLCEQEDHEWEDKTSIPPGVFLQHFEKICNRLDLVREIGPTFPLYRARIHKADQDVQNVKELATPPREFVKYPNRMSPSGIAMFYGACDTQTCLDEIGFDPKTCDCPCTLGQFELARPIQVLDLTSPLGEYLRPFSGVSPDDRRLARFMRGFVRDISSPIERDGREHVEYVPTQIVTEYVRRMMKAPDGDPIRGILYPSAKTKEGTCAVLFFENKEACEIHDGWVDEQDLYRKEPEFWLGLKQDSIQVSNRTSTL